MELSEYEGSKQQEEIIITLKDRDGNEYDATLLTVFQAGKQCRDYCAVLSHVPDKNGELQIQIFRYDQAEQDGMEVMQLSNVLSDMEYEEAKEILITLIDGGFTENN